MKSLMFCGWKKHSNLAIIVKKDNKVYHFGYHGADLNDEKVEMILSKIKEKL